MAFWGASTTRLSRYGFESPGAGGGRGGLRHCGRPLQAGQ